MKEKIKLSGVPETMLQTIYARAKESGGRGTIHDTKAEEIVGKLDYDFTLAEKDTAMHSAAGSQSRTCTARRPATMRGANRTPNASAASPKRMVRHHQGEMLS